MRSTQVIRQNSMDNSVLSIQRHNTDTRSFLKHPKFEIPHSMISQNSHNKNTFIDVKSTLINGIKWTESISKIQINPQFIELLVNQFSLEKIVIVSIWGPSDNSGKSFLTDTLLSLGENLTIRVFSKVHNDGANCSIRKLKTKDNNPILLLDWKGYNSSRTDVQSNVFLLIYLISSAIIFNTNNSNEALRQKQFYELCQKTKTKLVANQAEFSLPQLLIVKRDYNPVINHNSTNLLKSVSGLDMFQPHSRIINMPYPGTQTLKSNEINDVPDVLLNKNYIRTCLELLQLIKNIKPRYINDNVITSNMLAILLPSYSNMINKHHRVLIDTCWQQVLEALAVNGYNNFVTLYSEYLQMQFKDQRPLSQYDLFKKLQKVKTQTKTKLQNFTNIKGDPIFDKYKDKLKEFVKGKQQLIKSINASKSININNKFISENKRSNFPPNTIIKQQRLMSYLNSFKSTPIPDGKTELIVYNIRELINNDLKKIGNKAQAPELKALQQSLKQQDLRLKDDINKFNVRVNNLDGQLQSIRGNNVNYNSKLQEKQNQLSKMIQDNIKIQRQKQQKMSEEQKLAQMQAMKFRTQKQGIIQKQQSMVKQLKSEINNVNSKLRAESAEQNEIRLKIEQKNEALKKLALKIQQMDRLSNDKTRQIQMLKQMLSKPEKKKTTCGCFG